MLMEGSWKIRWLPSRLLPYNFQLTNHHQVGASIGIPTCLLKILVILLLFLLGFHDGKKHIFVRYSGTFTCLWHHSQNNQLHKDKEDSSCGDIQYFTCIKCKAKSQDRNADRNPRVPLVTRERIGFSEHHGGHLRANTVLEDVWRYSFPTAGLSQTFYSLVTILLNLISFCLI